MENAPKNPRRGPSGRLSRHLSSGNYGSVEDQLHHLNGVENRNTPRNRHDRRRSDTSPGRHARNWRSEERSHQPNGMSWRARNAQRNVSEINTPNATHGQSNSRSYRPPHLRNNNNNNNNNNKRSNDSNGSGHEESKSERNHDRRRNERQFRVGFKKLEEWSNKEPHVITVELIGQEKGFEELLESNMTKDTLVLVVKTLSKACLSPFRENKVQVMNLALSDNFIMNLQNYISSELPFQEMSERRNNSYFWNDVRGFFENLVIVFETLTETIPTRACEILPKFIKSMEVTLPVFENEQKQTLPTDIKERLHRLLERLELAKNEIGKAKKPRMSRPEDEEEEPPDDFRQLTVYPTTNEITTVVKAYVRCHRIKGAYDNVDQYLDVQFRLLREDFVAPLREGICEYLTSQTTYVKSVMKASNVKVHAHVEFVCPRYAGDQAGVLLQFEFKKKTEPKSAYRYYKRFMYGSLVCFTRDNFATLLFGRIIEREQELLEKGQIVIGFEQGYDNYKLNVPYVMVECSVYFEPYYHVLKALQNMDEDEFPMKTYFIDVETKIEPPDYLRPGTVYNIKDIQVPLFQPGAWPRAVQLGYDDTQYNAFRAALTQKFAVIQGPPGTGKTFLGLEIARTLIKNHKAWYNQTPILVVCYTNHALDQFLEGLIDTTKNIVRIGGQSKNEKLKAFNLREKRKSVEISGKVRSILRDLGAQLHNDSCVIKNLNDTLDQMQKFKSIVKFGYFGKIDPEFDNSWFESATNEQILQWLLGGRTHMARQREKHQARLEQLEEQQKNEEEALNSEVGMELDELLNAEARDGHDIDEFVELETVGVQRHQVTHLITVSDMQMSINEMRTDWVKLNDNTDAEAVFDKKWELERAIMEMEDNLEYLEMRLEEGRLMKLPKKPTGVDLKHPHNMSPDDRWKLYFYWLHKYRILLINGLVDCQNSHSKLRKQYMEIRDIEDTEIMKRMTVVGMTTTGAARLQTVLQALQCRIVIAEEAAEVLEAHIIVSLTRYCQHLILIGDHKQLRPSTANYRMEKHYNLGISLFERMVLNNIQCYVLGVQHRMRPEIAKLIVPSIYPKLENHASVYVLPKVVGIDSSLYFINHHYSETETGDSSKMNLHEAQFLIRLARYLVQTGYEPEDITIIAAYSGQMFALWAERKKYQILLKDVRITVLDNYQGEECKIILLSLVRSNKENKIGFLSIENRVCVALSRAKEGFYMMGNMDLLCQNSKLWPKVRASLESQDALGNNLALRCQIHREQVTKVRVPNDFNKVPEGGCSKECGILLNCGHTCLQICHVRDREHKTTKCKTLCDRMLCDNGHRCKKMCYETCGPCTVPMEVTLKCLHKHMIPCSEDLSTYKCRTPVIADLPCGHRVDNKPCCVDVQAYRCPYPCNVRVEPCGHACAKLCHFSFDPNHLQYKCYKPCAKPRAGCTMPEGEEHPCPKACFEACPPCDVIVKKARTICPHRYDVKCSVNVDEVECHRPCKKKLICGHVCKNKCYENCGNCQEKVQKLHPQCGHVIPTKCCEQPNRKYCNKRCPLKLPCGHNCKNKCNEPCTVECKELVDHTKDVACRHKFKISCYLLNQDLLSYSYELLKFCTQPCNAKLECEHTCSGTCGTCAQGRIHQSCQERCGVPLICGHACTIPCRETCQPCTQKCSYRCVHSICRKKCGEPCTSCKEHCTRKCKHVKCTAKCGDICTVPPCSEPCQETLKCGHSCIGFCGDPCPPLCRECNKEEVTEVFLGYEDEDDARFVVLDECKHVLESQGLDGWLQQEDKEINYKSCPKCKTPLCSTQRYSDYIKRNIKDVIAIKRKFFGNTKDNEIKRQELIKQLNTVKTKLTPLIIYNIPKLKLLLEDLSNRLQPVFEQKRQPLDQLLAQTYSAKIQILESIVDILHTAKFKHMNTYRKNNRTYRLSL
ncbi:hypothetical protein ILUMI_03228 [Ignelater luminosus]|uniref:NF-X1-type domain-containing protein n=1 Tax=Ignelater luminosus TaxID=2038154 RepID=A0A8K0DEZ4_IGNLU|nr:hypothetical protein ILUMI_03228 [Ignelater luminosus]